MSVTKEQIEQARRMDLLTYLCRYEPDELVKVGSSYATKTHGSLRVSENGLWNWFGGGIGGKTALDYLIKVQGMDFVAAVQHLCGMGPGLPVVEVKNVEQEKKKFVLPDRSKNMRALYGYLQGRGIPREIISECVRRKILFPTSSHGHNNCVFVGMNEEGVPKYASVRGCIGGFRMDIEGSEKKYGFSLLSEKKDCRVVAAFEAPIDAMSGAAIAYLKNGDRWKSMHYLSLGGLNYVPMDHFLELHPQVKTVCLCADQDQRGREFAERMMERYTERGIKILNKPPTIGKDYNDMLCAMTETWKTMKKTERE